MLAVRAFIFILLWMNDKRVANLGASALVPMSQGDRRLRASIPCLRRTKRAKCAAPAAFVNPRAPLADSHRSKFATTDERSLLHDGPRLGRHPNTAGPRGPPNFSRSVALSPSSPVCCPAPARSLLLTCFHPHRKANRAHRRRLQTSCVTAFLSPGVKGVLTSPSSLPKCEGFVPAFL